jgi:glucuronosyltransferase
MGFVQNIAVVWAVASVLCDKLLEDPPVQKLIHSHDQHFDVIIMEAFYLDCFLGFAHKFTAPVVQVCAFGGTEYMSDLVGNPNNYAYVPDAFLEFGDRMSFKERILNTLAGLFQKVGRRYFLLPKLEAIMKKRFNYTSSMPSISELEKSTAFVLVNHHFSISYPKPLLPNLVQVGGMHIKPAKDLSAVRVLCYIGQMPKNALTYKQP